MAEKDADKKEVKVYRLHKREKKKSNKDEYLSMCLVVAMNFPQYTIEEISEKLPFRLVKAMYNEIQAEKAETLLLLNGIINGPNEASKSKKGYKEVINHLIDLVNK